MREMKTRAAIMGPKLPAMDCVPGKLGQTTPLLISLIEPLFDDPPPPPPPPLPPAPVPVPEALAVALITVPWEDDNGVWDVVGLVIGVGVAVEARLDVAELVVESDVGVGEVAVNVPVVGVPVVKVPVLELL